MTTVSHSLNSLKIPADRALFEHQIQGLIAFCYENERPLQGLAGLMDWKFHGVISNFIKSGAISGRVGEITYLPVGQNENTYHLLLVGSGLNSSPGSRKPPSESTLNRIRSNLKTLKIERMGVSCLDFGEVTEDYFQKHFTKDSTTGGLPIWIVQ